MRFKIKKFIFILILFIFNLSLSLSACAFTPKSKILSAGELKAGERGYMLTVLNGLEPEKIPVKIISAVKQNAVEVNDYILIKLLKGEIARGMSGSPVYIRRNKGDYLIGAVSIGWDFADHSIAAVTPIRDMMNSLFNFENVNLSKLYELNCLNVAGISKSAALELGRSLGVEINTHESVNKNKNLAVKEYRFKPGDAVSALLAWGDVEIAATGTVTEVDLYNHDNFFAFGHSFLKRGNANYPAARARVNSVVSSLSFPFKIASPEYISGSLMQDKETGLAGISGYFVPSVAAELNFRNLDTGENIKKYFRVVYDEFLTGKILGQAFNGLVEEAWGRKGQGTMSVNLIIEANGINNSWARRDIFYDENNIEQNALKQANSIMNVILTQPYNKAGVMPLSVRLDIEATQWPRALLIEDIEAPESVKAGSEFEVSIKLRPWRGEVVTRKFNLRMPKDAAAGSVCELIVRGGGVQSSQQAAIDGGWLSVKSFSNMLEQIKALDANNELIMELNVDKLGEALSGLINSKNNKNKDKNIKNDNKDLLLPDEREYLSETKKRRIKEGSMRIFKSEYFVDGLMRRVISVE